uniref:SAP domain-containing protein n=1 Tax=Cupriavidus yeoncheonensis TaxID=1462994 RepID=UPI003F498A99
MGFLLNCLPGGGPSTSHPEWRADLFASLAAGVLTCNYPGGRHLSPFLEDLAIMGLLRRLFGRKEAAPVAVTPPSPTPSIAPPPAPSSSKPPTARDVDWRSSEIHLLLLSRFLDARPPDRVPEYFAQALGESPAATVQWLLDRGLLVPASLPATVAFWNSVADLKALLKERGLKVGGKKQELVKRLLDADETGMRKRHQTERIVECSLEARERVTQYLADKKREDNKMISAALAAIRAGDFAAASQLVSAHEAKQLTFEVENPLALPSPPRETEADVNAIQKIFTLRPKILSQMSERDWSALHVAQALSHLLHGRFSEEWLPPDFVGVTKFPADVARRMLYFHFLHVERVEKYRAAGVTEGKVLCGAPNQGTCPECMELDGKTFTLDKAPELPYERCTCELGCRCCLTAVISF